MLLNRQDNKYSGRERYDELTGHKNYLGDNTEDNDWGRIRLVITNDDAMYI